MVSRLNNILTEIRKITNFVPKIGVILGSGLGKFADDIRVIGTIPYSRLTGFPTPSVSGHSGKMIFGYVNKVPVVLMQGRVHYYEGYDIEEVVMPVRILGMMGAKVVMLTNSAGGINKNFYEGTLMVINDHISSFVPSPLIGPNIDEFGTRFPDMTNVYDSELKNVIINTARSLQIPVREGVYLQTTGPNYETPSEVRMYGLLGADAVGMSTAVEAMAARHMGIKVCGLSCITNMASGLSKKTLSHEEVKQTADSVSEKFRSLLWHAILAINNSLKAQSAAENMVSEPEKKAEKKNHVEEINFDDLEIIQIKQY